VNGIVFFSAGDVTHGYELWRSDGTAGGTRLVKDIAPEIVSFPFTFIRSSNPKNLVNVTGTLYFSANDATHGYELWKSDGTDAGTTLVQDIQPGPGNSGPQALTNVGGTLFFSANDGTTGYELWKSDGTAAGTVLVKDINPGSRSSALRYLTNVNGTLFFSANDGTHGTELWKSDGTAGGTVLVEDLFPGIGSSSPVLINVGGELFFSANDGTFGTNLWTSDGTASGTVRLNDPNSKPNAGSSPGRFIEFEGTTFFRANDATHGFELWKTDGTTAGTELGKDPVPGDSSFFVQPLTNVNGTFFFETNDGTHGYELWKTDGTEAGTVLIKSIVHSGDMANVNGTLFFDVGDYSLWKSDGTIAGTVLVKQFQNGDSRPAAFTNVNGTLFFVENDYYHGNELWKTDGTAAGTVLVKDIYPGGIPNVKYNDSNPEYLTNVNGTLFFSANDGTHGRELWKSDGTDAGTVMVAKIRSDGFELPGSYPSCLTNVNGTLFFAATDGIHGAELWKSDGTALGTVLVKDINPVSIPIFGASFVNVNGTLFFSANDGTHGFELWQSDGTAVGTVIVDDIQPGPAGSNPFYLTNVNGTLFFSADDGTHGVEPWVLGPVAPPSTVVGRDLFYAGSTQYDLPGGSNPQTPNPFSDDNAIATDKVAYLPGSGPATFANVSSYSLGINGIMVDLSGNGAHTAITLANILADFTFKVGNDNSPGSWTAAPLPSAVMVRPGAGVGGSDRVELVWANGAITQNWLEVTVKATINTGLAADDMFFFGSEVGDTGANGTPSVFKVGAADTTRTQIHQATLDTNIPIINIYDFNRDGAVGAADITFDQIHGTTNSTGLVVINIGASGPFAPPPAAPSASSAASASGAGEPRALALGLQSVASAVAVSAVSQSPPPPAIPRWTVNRLAHVDLKRIDLNRGPIAKYFEHVAHENTAKSRAILVKADQAADALGLDDELLDTLLVKLGVG
jgi:ELWxxDGT repeat protein